MVEPSQKIRRYFEEAGWSPGRSVPVPQYVPRSHPAFAILESYGGLVVANPGPGEECGNGDIAFAAITPEMVPEAIWNQYLDTRLICIGELDGGHGELFTDTRGRLFGSSIVHEAFFFEGENFNEAVENILFGRRSRPLLKPTQDHVMLYGERYERGDPRIFSC